MKPGNQRIKGATFERKLAKILKYIWPEARRGIQYRDGGKEASDIVGTSYHIECSKGGESIWAKWKQSKEDSCNGPPPIVIKQRDREEAVVMMSLQEWLRIEASRYCSIEEMRLLEEQYKKEFGKL